jgi:SAM-dependent methyltransferase
MAGIVADERDGVVAAATVWLLLMFGLWQRNSGELPEGGTPSQSIQPSRIFAQTLQAAAVAAENLANHESVSILQADLFRLPFAPESFNCIYSIGVLHHTPNCEEAFKALVPFLKPGGHIAIGVYSGYNKWCRFSDMYRRVTCRLPARWLHALCHVALPLYYVHGALRRVPVLGRYASGILSYLLPVSLHPNRDTRVLDTFDWYSPKYQSKHTYEEVFRLFESSGLGSLRVLYEPVAVQGRKPLPVPQTRSEGKPCVASQAL